jgi:hypothetical protein
MKKRLRKKFERKRREANEDKKIFVKTKLPHCTMFLATFLYVEQEPNSNLFETFENKSKSSFIKIAKNRGFIFDWNKFSRETRMVPDRFGWIVRAWIPGIYVGRARAARLNYSI